MFIAGLLASFFMGTVLSFLGAGGSILTLPILVYLFQIDIIQATTYSLLLVGLTAVFGCVASFKDKLIDFKTGIIFGIPSIIGVVLARKVVLPFLPDQILVGNFILEKSFLIMILFAVLMLVSSSLMIRDRKPVLSKTNDKNAYERNIIIILEGLIVGQLTGFVGAGGGFLIIPALVLLTGLSMNIAVATSLFIIAIKSLMGYLSDVIDGFQTDWMFVFYVCLFTLVGVFFGRILSKKVSDKQTKKLFGYMTLIISFIIIIEQLIS
ncbi:MAG: sulfite exporter TauE/SafE family protein [Pelagibacteraceae bacterium]|jgi:uncharacterized membrane protein YfcA